MRGRCRVVTVRGVSTIRRQGTRLSDLARTAPAGAAADPGTAGSTPPADPGGATVSDAIAEGLKVAADALDNLASAISPPPGGPQTTGVIFVHGIGSQAPGETLLQWSGPLIEGVTAWRSWAAPPTGGLPRDTVIGATMDFTSELPTITMTIPAIGAYPEARWILTESWWAAKVSPPSLTTMTSWLGPQRGAEQIVSAILGNPSATSKWLGAFKAAVVPFVSVLGALILSGYGLLRTITRLVPIQAAKDAAILRVFDNFLTGWFGDVRILLFDPAQSANIRDGLATAVERMRERGCSRVVVVAHSGGAMVSYLTLTDPSLAPRAQVDKLITFGEGWNLAITLTPDGAGMADRLRRDITVTQEKLRWRDFWASHDPAPAGQVKTAEIKPPSRDATPPVRPDAIRSYRVWNRRSLLDDHGTYFENDEEFTIPVLREIDAADDWGESSRFFPDPATEPPIPAIGPPSAAGAPPTDAPPGAPMATRDDPRNAGVERVLRHRQRVGLLAIWRHFSLSMAVAVVSVVLSSSTRLEELGKLVAMRLPRIPILADGIDWLRSAGAITIDLPVLPPIDLLPAATLVGLATLQAIVLIAVLQLAAAPAGAYHAWPEGTPRRRLAKSFETVIALGLLASLAPLVFSSFVPPTIGTIHERFLGAGGATWLPGLAATILTLALAWGGPELVRIWKKPAAARLFGAVSTTLFLIAMASAVVAIFHRDGLEMAELGYIVIWAAFLLLYKIGHNRWSQWDRVERFDAYGRPGHVWVTRKPALVSTFGFLAASFAVVAYVFAWPQPVLIGMIVVAVVLIVSAMAASALWWRRGDPYAAPPAVDTGGV